MQTGQPRSLSAEEFVEPFRSIYEGAKSSCRILHEELRPHFSAAWQSQSLVVDVIDSDELNASADSYGGNDFIKLNRGTVERLYGTMFGLLSVPTFLPQIGNCDAETAPLLDVGMGFPIMPLIRSDGSSHVQTLIPKDPTRKVIAHLLAELALKFLLYHEIGHIVGGHREWKGQAINERGNLEFRRILECDADAFAWDVTSWVQTQEEMSDTIYSLAPNVPWGKLDLSLILYFTAIGVLFRILYDERDDDASHDRYAHPHPAVRSCLVCSYTFARVATSDASQLSVADCMCVSIRNIEDVWADLFPNGQLPKVPKVWATEIAENATKLCTEYRLMNTELDARARIARRWARSVDGLAGGSNRI